MKLPLLKVNISRRLIAYCAAVAAVAFASLYFALTRGTGEIRLCGRTYRFPVPYASVQLRSSENSTTFFTLGYPDLKGVFASRGARLGWGDAYQFGGAYSIFSTPDETLSMTAIVELRTTEAAEIEFRLNECGPRDCALPPFCPKVF